MKKMILVAMTLAAGYGLNAQITAPEKIMPSHPDSSYNVPQTVPQTDRQAVPQTILTNFNTAYPTAGTVTWEPTDGWWSGRYIADNKSIRVVTYSTQPYYLEPGRDESYFVALPVMNNFVPESVIAAAVSGYGANLYSITTIKSANNDDVYQLALIDKGISRTVWMNAESIAYTDTYKIRTTNEQQQVKMNQE